jgi:LCP family protein required for cell wall assembly
VLGWVLFGLLVLAVGGGAIWYATSGGGFTAVLGLAKYLTSRTILIVIVALLVLVALVWLGQILLSNMAHNTKERLKGPRRWFSLGLAVVMMVGAVIPLGYATQSVWSLQDLIGDTNVFRATSGGDDDPIVEGKDPWADKERVNIMLLGQDAGKDRTGTRPDTIMVASIDTATGRTALFSIPRNLEHVRFPEGSKLDERFPDGFRYYGTGQDLINAVWSWAGDEPDLFEDDEDPGLTATTMAVEETLGLDIDYYAMVNLQGFADLVDAIGGVDMNVERRIPIGGGTNESTGGKYPITGYIEPGEQELDGDTALWYARSREGSNDFNRICRQQRMIRVVTEEADPATLALSFPKLVGVGKNNIETDIPSDRLDAFVELAARIKEGGFTSYPITPEVTNPGNADWDYIKKYVKSSIKDSTKTEEATSVKGTEDKDSSDGSSTEATPSEEATTKEVTPNEDRDPEDPNWGDDLSDKYKDENPLWSCMPGTADANP